MMFLHCKPYVKPRSVWSVEDLSSVHTVNALLLAGLYPNVARIDVPKARGEFFCCKRVVFNNIWKCKWPPKWIEQ